LLHVFIVHSSITSLAANSIIEYLNLSSDRVIVLTGRNAKLNGFKNIQLPNLKLLSAKNIFYNKKILKEFDQFLKKATLKKEYKVYLPQSANWKYHLVMSNPYCVEINYLEEGLSSYLAIQKINLRDQKKYSSSIKEFIATIINRVTFGKRLNDKRVNFACNDPKYKFSFGLNKNSFPDFNGRKIIPIKFQDDLSPEFLSVRHLYIMGSEVEAGLMEEGEYLSMLTSFCLAFKKLDTTLFLKWHPGQDNNLKGRLLNLFQTHLDKNLMILPGTVPIEKLSYYNEKIKVYQSVSSAGFYSSIFGRKVYSISFLAKYLKKDRSGIDLLPNFYFKSIKHFKSDSELNSIFA